MPSGARKRLVPASWRRAFRLERVWAHNLGSGTLKSLLLVRAGRCVEALEQPFCRLAALSRSSKRTNSRIKFPVPGVLIIRRLRKKNAKSTDYKKRWRPYEGSNPHTQRFSSRFKGKGKPLKSLSLLNIYLHFGTETLEIVADQIENSFPRTLVPNAPHPAKKHAISAC